ncbi:CatB-related O-acetyltransferase [Legionella septentrionalis]|uniref:CatB-related O-acetyltransferase n=1 Tax=Legionella septentrionalis TaxID=2498109 RepID=A0A3S0XFP0_9GAMM|nr:CatB-related O-acetyltransferase [Legionella septentrionalis]RUQ84495.1 CatB-related O-acetyltransferase [Legionella septentrionalis]RUQ96456.1 CatB-related O-acetyltransferase [Legionella septentrionalis]RUR14537.1 CatB-related O-acetyltransferase [Legionella septentrionalis]
MHPAPDTLYPIPGSERTVFLKNIVKNPNIIIGDYTYYDDPVDIYNFEKNVLYHFDFIGDKLIIGKFCQIAANVKFMMNGGNHYLDGFSSFPFIIFQSYWPEIPFIPNRKKDTVIGNDVWIGYDATIMPGVNIGDGAIIGTRAVVTKDVAPYEIVGGNPAQVIRKRFDDETIDFLLQLQWWDWPIEKIRQHVLAIMDGNKNALADLL